MGSGIGFVIGIASGTWLAYQVMVMHWNLPIVGKIFLAAWSLMFVSFGGSAMGCIIDMMIAGQFNKRRGK